MVIKHIIITKTIKEKMMINVAIIGTGVISEQHIKAYQIFSERCEILAVCDIFPEKAKAQKEKYHLENAIVYEDYKHILERKDIQLVSICTPPFTHASCAIECMQSGKHVLVEKPMAASLEECDEIIQIQRKSGSHFGVVSQNRYTEENQNLKRLLTSKIAGQVCFGQAESFWFRGHSYYDLWWRGTWGKEGGGCTLNHAVHQIDLLNWMLGRPKTVTAILGNVAHDNAETEDVSVAIFTYESGAIVTLSTSLVTHGEGQKIVFQCEKASLASPWNLKCSGSTPTGFPVNNPEMEALITEIYSTLPQVVHTNHAGQIDNVLRFLETGEQVAEDSSDGRLALEVITAIYQSGFTGKTIALPLEKDNPFYTKEGILANVQNL